MPDTSLSSIEGLLNRYVDFNVCGFAEYLSRSNMSNVVR